LMFGLVFAAFLLTEPWWKSVSSLQQTRQQQLIQQQTQQAQLDELSAREPKDPNIALRNQLAQLESRIRELQRQASHSTGRLVSAAEMVGLLQPLLLGLPGIELLSMENLQPKPIRAVANGGEQEQKVGQAQTAQTDSEKSIEAEKQPILLWQQGLRLRIKATYPGMTRYLQRLEQLPKQLIWHSLDYRQSEYPWGELTLEIHTLSPQQEVLGV
ncbi:MAG: hypothetical protein ACPGYX_12885, partial [Oceanobacter sp.]